MTYNPLIPQPTDQPSASQSQILTNFTQLNTIFSSNHYAFNDATVALRGQHRVVVLEQQAVGPATTATQGALYTKAWGGSPNIYFRRKSSGSEVLMTANTDPIALPVGYTFLPNSMGIQWGIANAPAGVESGDINFAIPFSAGPYSVVCTMIRNSNTTNTIYVVTGTVTTTRFHVRNTDTGGAHDFYWMAIGPV
jgi:hypothetical protein